MNGKLTKPMKRALARLGAAHPDAYISLEVIDRGYVMMPLFRARLKSVPCPTCGHPSKEEPMAWGVVEALAKVGAVEERIPGSSAYFITALGRTAIKQGAGE